jgi:DNA-binding transcriptional ArsR family regulator
MELTMNEITLPDELLTFLKAVSDAERLRLLGALTQAPGDAAELARRVEVKPSAVTRHLAYLEETGLVSLQGETVYHFNPKQLERIARQYLGGPRPVFQAGSEVDQDDSKVLKAFVNPDGSLKQIPLQPKKTRVIVNYIKSAFEEGVQYSEKEVNEILRRYHADTSTLRRYLIDYKILARAKDGAAYWMERS